MGNEKKKGQKKRMAKKHTQKEFEHKKIEGKRKVVEARQMLIVKVYY